MNQSLSAPATFAECTDQEASIVLEHLTAADAMSIGQSILELASDWFPSRPVAVHLETDNHPLFVRDEGRVGTLVVSGLEGWEDHALAVGGLERWLGKAWQLS